ncbi:TPA: hypothetical protein IHJ80_004986 [Escherichia coli]|nr:hypothetical protein [Escherichia coli]
MSEKVANTRYVLKTGDTMTGSLTIANSASIKSNDTSLVLYFRNASGGERAAVYHNSSNNTLRLRSGGAEVTVNSSGTLAAPSLTVSNNSATVGGKNIVRSINGTAADASGNVTLQISTNNVQSIRLSARIETSKIPDSSWTYTPEGAFMDGVWISVNGSSGTHLERISYRYVQMQINGNWETVRQQ